MRNRPVRQGGLRHRCQGESSVAQRALLEEVMMGWEICIKALRGDECLVYSIWIFVHCFEHLFCLVSTHSFPNLILLDTKSRHRNHTEMAISTRDQLIAYVVIHALLLIPVFVLAVFASKNVRKEGDPARKGFTWLIVSLWLFVLYVASPLPFFANPPQPTTSTATLTAPPLSQIHYHRHHNLVPLALG